MKKKFIADFHIHSHYSIATSKFSNFYEYAKKAYYKGIDLIGTGDGIHPGLLNEIEEYLTEDENNGLLKLKEEYQKKLIKEIPNILTNKNIRFIITTEISTIYKKNNKVRKLHHLFLIPDLPTAKKISKKLDSIGNIRSDGRPILGMDSSELLKIFLDINEDIIYIPAHIWTPHFSLFGAKSGFDTIEECFGDLEKYIYAVETGLSSDPPMNWLISQLDNRFLVSNSDAHSPENLGREANLFHASFSYNGILNALKNTNNDDKILGTIEFYPEEGKYHWDGHRKCGIYLSPKEAKKYNNICPVCGKPLTMGVLHRVYELADKPENTKGPKAKPFHSIVTLKQIIADSINKNPKSKAVEKIYNNIIRANGNEFDILLNNDIDNLKINEPIIKYAISKVRNNNIYIRPGFDGEYGIVSVFSPEEKKEILSNAIFIDQKIQTKKDKIKPNNNTTANAPELQQLSLNITPQNQTQILNKNQEKIINNKDKFVFIQAGPGTGKTFTIIKKLETLKKELETNKILFVTFTDSAANEIKNRINISSHNLYIGTFHSISKRILQEIYNISINLITTQDQIFILQQLGLKKGYNKFLIKIEQYKIDGSISVIDEEKLLIQKYINFLQQNNLYDFNDILLKFIEIHDSKKFLIKYLFVDEVQDCNKLQFNWIKKLTDNLQQLILIGDYYQSLYKFRGAEPETILKLDELFPKIKFLTLQISYRLPQNFINISSEIISKKTINISLKSSSDEKGDFYIIEHPNSKIEKSFFIKELKKLIGTLDMNIGNTAGEYYPNDIAFIFRTNQKLKEYLTYFRQHNFPVKVFFDDTFLKNEKIIKILYALRAIENKNNKFFEEIFYKISRTNINLMDSPENLLKKINFICSSLNISNDDDIELLIDILQNSDDLNSTINELLNHKRISNQKNNINFLTVHSAKGLEFPVVIIPSLQKNYFPIKNGDMDEEERLFYVALTRSSEKIYLSYTTDNDNGPSIFIKKLKNYSNFILNYPEKKYRQLSLF